jgi:predicted anti-sigma-YlaC factor YlaD
MMCSPEKIYAYLENELSRQESALLEAHLQKCSACIQHLEQSRTLFNEIEHLPDLRSPESFEDQIIERTYDDLTMTFQNPAERRRALVAGSLLSIAAIMLLSLPTVVNYVLVFLSGIRAVGGIVWNAAHVVLQGLSLIATGLFHRMAVDVNVSPLPAIIIATMLSGMFAGLIFRLYASASR